MSTTDSSPVYDPRLNGDPRPDETIEAQSAGTQEDAILRELEDKPWPVRAWGYTKLSGPGWLQSALTLGGGSLTGSLYIGVLAGASLLWLQPFAMILGIISLAAIGYVTLSTGERPFRLINRHINPALGWMWLIASMLANMVWALPQYSLANSVMQQVFFPEFLGAEGPFGIMGGRALVAGTILVIATIVTWSYGSGHWGVRLYERILKVVVAAIVVCFVLVVGQYIINGALPMDRVLAGFVPSFSTLTTPAPQFQEILAQIAETDSAAAAFWREQIVTEQVGWAMTAFGTAVGINMTFLLPYSMLGRGWGKLHRGMSIFDLSTGMFIPFLLATSCVVIAAMVQFHGQMQPGLVGLVVPGELEDANVEELLERARSTAEAEGYIAPTRGQIQEYLGSLNTRSANTGGTWSESDERVAAMLVSRDAPALSQALSELLGSQGAKLVFGLGVLAMALSTISLLMLVSGFVVCEVLDVPATGWPMRLGCLAAATGVIGPFLGDSFFYLAQPTSVFGLALLPIAYLTFLLMINNKNLMGKERPQGGKRVLVNILLGVSTLVAFIGSLWAISAKLGVLGLAGVVAAFLLLLAIGAMARGRADVETVKTSV